MNRKAYHKIDLHMHTEMSDGDHTPEEILIKVKEAGLELFSVTDHDTDICVGIIPKLLGPGDPDYIPGVEFSCKDKGDEGANKYHILGYGFDPKNEKLRTLLDTAHEFRMEKARKRLEFLKSEFNMEFPQEEVDKFLERNSPAKPHLAQMIIDHSDDVNSIKEAVERFINKKKFNNVNPRPEEAIEAILDAGGIPVLAHGPFGDGENEKDPILGEALEKRVKHLVDCGLQGLEGYYCKYTPEIQQEVLDLAEKYELYVTAGSDFHGQKKKPGLYIGDNHLEDASEGPDGLRRFLNDVMIIRSEK